MNIIKSFFGFYDKKQKERTEEVSEYVHSKNNEFTSEMIKLHAQVKRVHKKTRQAHEESVKLNEMINDITSKIAIVTSKKK